MESKLENRMIIIQRIILIAALVLIGKAAEIQLFDSSYHERAEATTLDKMTLYPSRGLVFDRNDKLLVYNDPVYDLKVTFNQLDPDMDTSKFCNLLQISKEEFNQRMNKDWSSVQFSKSVPFSFMNNLHPSIYTVFQESLHEFPGVSSVLRNVRGYNHNQAAHVLGYISEVDKQKIESSENIYTQGDYIGASGIEYTYENELRGQKGISYVFKDNLGRDVGTLNEGKLDSAAISGTDIRLTLDLDLQRYGESLMQNKKGSIVCLEPATGEILAMVSSPSYDPALLTIHRGRTEAYNRLNQDTVLTPFFNRATMAIYPPGSIFKPILALIAMQEGVLSPQRTIYCDGAYHYRHFSYGCHSHSIPYGVDIALQHSCNSYFFQVFRDIVEKQGFNNPEAGLAKLNDYLMDFGLNQKLGVDIPSENSGNIPDGAYYDQLYGKGTWRSTYMLSLGIGQGELQFTSLQMANLAAIIANRGHYYTPHLLKEFIGSEDNSVHPEKNIVHIENDYFEPVVEGMERAVRAGTAVNAYHPEISICGKTGTSQNPQGKDHSVFFAFAPKENPRIAISVYVENGGWGATYAAPIASLMIERYLTRETRSSRKWIESRILESDLITVP